MTFECLGLDNSCKILLTLHSMDKAIPQNHENMYPTNKSTVTVYTLMTFWYVIYYNVLMDIYSTYTITDIT